MCDTTDLSQTQKALLAQVQLSIISDVVTNYYTLWDIQQQIVLAKEDERLVLLRAQTLVARWITAR